MNGLNNAPAADPVQPGSRKKDKRRGALHGQARALAKGIAACGVVGREFAARQTLGIDPVRAGAVEDDVEDEVLKPSMPLLLGPVL